MPVDARVAPGLEGDLLAGRSVREVPRLSPVAVRASGQSGIGPARYRGAVFAGDNPYSWQVWASLGTRSKAGPAVMDAVAAVSHVRRGFQLCPNGSKTTQVRPSRAEAA